MYLGYSIDVVSSRLLGLNAFAMSLVFLAVYFSSRSIWLHHPVVSSLIVLFAALVKGVALVLVWVVFLSTEGFWMGAVRYIIMEALHRRQRWRRWYLRCCGAAKAISKKLRRAWRNKPDGCTWRNQKQDGAPELRRRARLAIR